VQIPAIDSLLATTAPHRLQQLHITTTTTTTTSTKTTTTNQGGTYFYVFLTVNHTEKIVEPFLGFSRITTVRERRG